MARKPVSAATKLKIARSLKGNKNAFKGGPKKGLSTREKIANINAATKAKKAHLSPDQIARRQSVAKRLRAQARKEEALGGGNPGELKTNAETVSAALAQSDRLKAGALKQATQAKSADDIRAATAKLKEARAALKDGMPRSSRKESAAKVQPSAKQNLNAPQKPAEQRSAALSPAQRRRKQASKFEADQAKARLAQTAIKAGDTVELNGERRIVKAVRSGGITEFEGGGLHGLGMREGKLKKVEGGASEFARQQGAQVVDVPISGRGSRGGGLKADPIATSKAMRELQAITGKGVPKRADNAAYEKAMGVNNKQDKPRPPQSDTGSDRSGTFVKDVPVKLTDQQKSQRIRDEVIKKLSTGKADAADIQRRLAVAGKLDPAPVVDSGPIAGSAAAARRIEQGIRSGRVSRGKRGNSGIR